MSVFIILLCGRFEIFHSEFKKEQCRLRDPHGLFSIYIDPEGCLPFCLYIVWCSTYVIPTLDCFCHCRDIIHQRAGPGSVVLGWYSILKTLDKALLICLREVPFRWYNGLNSIPFKFMSTQTLKM